MGAPFELTVEAAVRRVREREPIISAFISKRLDEALLEPPGPGPLSGVPYALKDEWETLCLPTTGGSWRFRERRSPHDGPVKRAFDAAGAVMLGKTNLSDLGLVPEASSWVGGTTRNPHALGHTPGGSSGGAAAAVADGMVAFDWGTDIGGSIRIPAGFTGIYGLRLSSRTWPIDDMFPPVPATLSWLCAQGPLTRSLPQMRAVLDAVAPALCRGGTVQFVPKHAAIVLPGSLGAWPDVERDLSGVLDALKLKRVAVDGLPSPLAWRLAYAGVWASHLFELMETDETLTFASGFWGALSGAVLRGEAILDRPPDRRFYPLTAETLLLVALGRFTFFWSKTRALARAHAMRDAGDRAFDDQTLLIMPVATVPAPLIGQTNRTPEVLESCILGNILDSTAIAVPFGRFPNGLPRALQLMGPPGCEGALMDLAERIAQPA